MTDDKPKQCAETSDLVKQARKTREAATRYQLAVDRYCREMPGLLDAFHHHMFDCHEKIRRLQLQ